ncbi:MAG: Flp pilus assembly complex ATPase component TadA [Candidatus Omnitrophica bacterium]|nr:Flp pilus assembly complex ATPase component TadA [Candidatus Omnitrophota bacterium]
MNTPIERTGYRIVAESGFISKEDLDRIYRESENSDLTFSQLLVRSGLLKESELLGLYAKHLGIPFINLKTLVIDKAILSKVPVKFAAYYKFFPMRLNDRRLTIAISKLLDVHVLDEIRFGLGYEIETVLAPEKEIEEMLNRYYGLGADTVDKILTHGSGLSPVPSESMSTHEVEDIETLAETPSVVQLVNQIILDAYKKRASDIHLEPYRDKVRLRYRIDGQLYEQNVPPEWKKFFMSILSRIKIMANLNIVERRLPQDGKARVKTQEQTLDLRISSIPTPHGESMVIRLLPSRMILNLDQIGFHEEHRRTFEALIRKPHGVIFMTGPTGSGKSTTLYAGLNALNTVERKIITIEDPVEYELEGIAQLQVTPEIGLTFARGLRNMLRHDPDVMMVGEVRDLETADIAIRAALTGHLILSTLHTNDASSGVTRLLDIGVEPYLIASSVVAFIAQRLVRVVCPHCSQEKQVSAEVRAMIAADLEMSHDEEMVLRAGRGCDECNGTGFWGRTAIHEILIVNEKIRELIFRRASSEEIKLRARELGMVTLRRDGWRKVLSGLTTPEEVLQLTPADEVMEKQLSAPPHLTKKEDGEGLLLSSIEADQGPPHERDETSLVQDKPKRPERVGPSETKQMLSAFTDRRSYPRIKIEASVKFRVIDISQVISVQEGSPQWDQMGKTEDVSASGVAFLTHHFLTLGNVLEMTILLPDKQQKEIHCVGRVIRVVRVLDSTPPRAEYAYKVAVSFLAIPSDDRLRIEHFCKEQGSG